MLRLTRAFLSCELKQFTDRPWRIFAQGNGALTMISLCALNNAQNTFRQVDVRKFYA